MRFASSSSPTTPPPPRALLTPPRGVGVGGGRARLLRRDGGSSSSSSSFPKKKTKGRKTVVVVRAAKNDSPGGADDDESASSSSSAFNLFSRRKSVVEDPGENAITTTSTSSSASIPLIGTLFKGNNNKEEATRNNASARESKKVVSSSSSLFHINERSKQRREEAPVEKNAKIEPGGKQKTSLVSRLLTSIGGKKEGQEREQREETKREEKKSAAGAVAETASGMSIDEVPVVGSIARAIKSRRVDRIPVPVVGTFSELYRHAEIATMNDWKEEDVKEWFKKRGEEARVLEVPSIDQRVILAVNDREKRITIGLRGTKTLVNAAQNLRLTTSAPTFRNNNISLGGSSIDGTQQQQQQRRFPTIKFPTITDARRKELFEEFPDFNVKMHRGYRTIAMVVKREVNQYLKDGYEVDLQGHSLGGACALALALLYHHEGKTKVRRVVTFGSPKLGPKDTQDAAEKAGLEILRVVQKDDIFPFLPMSRPGVTQPYVHCGEGIYLDSDQPGKFAELPRWYGGSGILWRQKAIVTEAYKSSLKKRNETLLSADYDPLQPEKINVPGIGPRNEKIAKWVKRIRRQRFLKARQTLFSFANEDYALAAALGRDEIKDLSDASSGSFDEEDSTLMKAGLEPSKMDIVDLSNKERRLESKMTVGPTIFERLRDLQKFDQKERVRRLECHRMVRYRDEVKSLMDVGPQQVNLNDMFDDLYTNFSERKKKNNNKVITAATNTAGNTNNNSNNIASNGGRNGVKATR
jgi:pimeloyl-ACP methyl ester carboxylesterase